MTISWCGRKAVSYFYAIIIGACIEHYFPSEVIWLIFAFIPFGIKLKWTH